jgi:DNA-binding MarR family transcriptional regulator
LRVPSEQNLLEPHGLHPLAQSFDEVVRHAPRYHPVELFGDGIEPESIRKSLSERKERAISLNTWNQIARVERLYGKAAGWIRPGETNQALCEIIPVYRSAGLSVKEAAMEFYALIAPGYHGELLSFKRLIQRITSFYRKIPQTRFTQAPAVQEQEDLFTEHLAQILALLLQAPTETRQQKAALTRKRATVKKAVVFLEGWLAYLRDVIGNKRWLEMWDYLYPYFKKNTKAGYYPIPSTLFRGSMLEHYERWLLPFFLEAGYLERFPHPYSNLYGICYYYRINSDRFIGQEVPSKREEVPPRVSKVDARAARIRAYKQEHPDMSNRAIARALGIPETTVRRLLKG